LGAHCTWFRTADGSDTLTVVSTDTRGGGDGWYYAAVFTGDATSHFTFSARVVDETPSPLSPGQPFSSGAPAVSSNVTSVMSRSHFTERRGREGGGGGGRGGGGGEKGGVEGEDARASKRERRERDREREREKRKREKERETRGGKERGGGRKIPSGACCG